MGSEVWSEQNKPISFFIGNMTLVIQLIGIFASLEVLSIERPLNFHRLVLSRLRIHLRKWKIDECGNLTDRNVSVTGLFNACTNNPAGLSF